MAVALTSLFINTDTGRLIANGTQLDVINRGDPRFDTLTVSIVDVELPAAQASIVDVPFTILSQTASTLTLQLTTVPPAAGLYEIYAYAVESFETYTYFDVYGWVPIADWVSAEVNSACLPSSTGRILCELWSTGAQATKCRLRNTTHSLTVGTSAAVSSGTPVTADFPVILTSGVHRYRLEVGSRWTGTDLFCIGAGLIV
jgi:hypothetical protein